MSDAAPTPEERITRLVQLLQDMDRTQRQTDEDGGREVAWYYFRDAIEDALGLERGTLNTGVSRSLEDIFASVRDRVESEGGTWPLKPPPGLGPVRPDEEPTT